MIKCLSRKILMMMGVEYPVKGEYLVVKRALSTKIKIDDME